MKKEIRLKVSKKFADISIESFLTSDEIGASINLLDLEAAIVQDIKDPLVLALSEYIGSPAFMMTKKGLAESLNSAASVVLKKEISDCFERIISEMKESTTSVAALKQLES